MIFFPLWILCLVLLRCNHPKSGNLRHFHLTIHILRFNSKTSISPIQDLGTSKGFFSKFPLSSRVFFTWELYPLHMSSNFPPQNQPQTPWGTLTCQMSGICLEGILLFYHNLIVTLCHIISHRLTLQSSFYKIQK